MKSLVLFCVKRPVAMIMAVLALFLGALLALLALPLEKLPPLSYPRVTVETAYPGMAASDIRSIVTIPLEDALSSVKGLERMRSVSRDGASLVILDFRWGLDPNTASLEAREIIDGVYPVLPEGTEKPLVVPGDSREEAHAVIAVRAKNGDQVFARRLAEYELKARFRRIEGLSGAVLSGGDVPELSVELDLNRMVRQGAGPAVVAEILSRELADMPGGSAREGSQELVIVGRGKPEVPGELASMVLPGINGPLYASDISRTILKPARKKSIFIYNNEEQVCLELFRRQGSDPVGLSRDIRRTVKEAEKLFSKDAEIRIVYDGASEITGAMTDFFRAAALGVAAVGAILAFFMGRIRYCLLAGFSIPFSAAAVLAALAASGRSLNSMSLSGLTMGIGLVSDVSVIVLDLLHRSFGNRFPGTGETADAVSRVSLSSFAGTLTTIVVFLPVFFLPGPLGALYGDLSLSLIVSVSSGWAYSQFILPPLYRFFFTPERKKKISPNSPARESARQPEAAYRRFLRTSLRHPGRAVFAAGAFSVFGMVLLASRPAVFMPPDEAGELELAFDYPPGTDLEFMAKEGKVLSEKILKFMGVRDCFGRAGSEAEDSSRRADTGYRRERLVFRCFLEQNAGVQELMEELGALSGVAGTSSSVRIPEDSAGRLLGLSSSSSLAIKAPDRETLGERADGVRSALEKAGVPGIFNSGEKRPEIRIYPDREAVAFLGVSSSEIAETLYAATSGLIAGQLEADGRPLNIRVSAMTESPGGVSPGMAGAVTRETPDEYLARVPLVRGDGGAVPLGALVHIKREEADSELTRLDRSDTLYLELGSGPEKTLRNLSRELLRNNDGISRADESAFRRYRFSLVLTLVLVVILLYMTLGAQFESFSLPLIIMLSIPFSLAGAGPLLFASGSGLDSGSVLGLTVLFGLAVNNGIVLYEISAEKIQNGFSPPRAVYSGAGERLRPVLITTLTTLSALLPAFLSPMGASQRSMAAAMFGGMAASTLLCLFVLPPVLVRFLKKRTV
ncbi:MAG: efflux RND transporter permease subunit [Spirochaetaceae bacterium]|jgi:multidrug efflux pump subunit AcrB|nr:efflux RND transporter permease subunit [Spirochaetaceae bacterium]